MSPRYRTMLGQLILLAALAIFFLAHSGTVGQDEESSEVASRIPPAVAPLAERKIPSAAWLGVVDTNQGQSMKLISADKRKFAFSPGGELLIIEDTPSNRLEVWQISTSKCLARFGETEGSSVLCFSPDGKSVAHAAYHEVIEVWDVPGQKTRHSFGDGEKAYVLGLAFSPDGRTLAVATFAQGGGNVRTVRLRDVGNGKIVKSLSEVPQGDTRTGNGWISALTFSPDGRSLALAAGDRLFLWDIATGKEQRCLGSVMIDPAAERRDGFVTATLAFSPDSRILAVGCNDGTVRRWELSSGRELPLYLGHTRAVRALTYAPDGKSILSFGLDGRVLTWPAGDPTREWKPEGPLSNATTGLLWERLARNEVRELYGAVQMLAARPKTSIPFLKEVLKPIPEPDRARLTTLVDGLKNPDYNERKKAAVELRPFGELALPELRSREEHHDRMIDRWRENLENREPSPEEIRASRAIRILEQIGTDDARQFLDVLSRGAAASALTVRAKDSLLRLPSK